MTLMIYINILSLQSNEVYMSKTKQFFVVLLIYLIVLPSMAALELLANLFVETKSKKEQSLALNCKNCLETWAVPINKNEKDT